MEIFLHIPLIAVIKHQEIGLQITENAKEDKEEDEEEDLGSLLQL